MIPFLARSYLFAPGSNDELLRKVFEVSADAVVLDLEDSVREDDKSRARESVARALKEHGGYNRPTYVRINPVGGSFWRQDIEALGRGLFGIRLAKSESAEQVLALGEAISAMEERVGLPVGGVRIMPTIESAAGLLAAGEIARAPRVEALCFGMTDFLHDINGEEDELGLATLHAQSHLVLVSRSAGLRPPVASVYTRLNDLHGLRATSEAARRLGFFGRSCIHPKQIEVVHEVFTPSAKGIAQAQAIVAASERSGAGTLAMNNGQFVDEAVVKRARAILSLAANLERTSEKKVS